MVGRRWFSNTSQRDVNSSFETNSIRTEVTNEGTVAGESEGDTESSEEDGATLLSVPSQRIKQLFRRRTEDLFVELDEPHRVYVPGDAVRGRVILTLKNETKTLYTRLHFGGQVRVGTGKQVAKTNLFRQHLTLWGTRKQKSAEAAVDKDSVTQVQTRTTENTAGADKKERSGSSLWRPEMMCAGRHVFEFEVLFPLHSLPSSVDFGRGSVSYFLRAEHQKPTGIPSRGRSVFRKELAVLDSIDIGSLPPPKKRHIEPDQKSKRREGTGRVHATVELARAGYLKGETITLNIQVNHIKPIKSMNGTIATLYRLSRFDATDLAPQSFRKDLSQSILPILVDPVTLDYRVSPRLRVPSDVFPTIKAAGPVSFRYFVEVVLDLNGRTTVWQTGPAFNQIEGTGGPHAETYIHATDTDAIKREKGTHCVVFEVIIGTRQSRPGQRRRASLDGATNPSAGRASTDGGISAEGARLPGPPRSQTPLETPSSERSFPLSKAALRDMEAALLPSMPPECTDDEEQNSIDEAAGLPHGDQRAEYALVSGPSAPPLEDSPETEARIQLPSLEMLHRSENGALPAYHHGRSSQA